VHQSKDNKIKDILQEIKIHHKPLKDVFMLALKKEKGENIEMDIQNLKKRVESPDLHILLSLLAQ
jgi:hypothetical protein